MNNSKISIITVSFNAVNTIENTILSVINQTYPNIEYIIIDGGSTDGTIEIIKKYEDKISYWISEPDKGIYDAMNKGIDKTTGEWINFMNAGDSFYNNEVISSIFKKEIDNLSIKVIYGDTYYIQKEKTSHIKAQPFQVINLQLPFCHQSSFIRNFNKTELLFDLKYRIAADYNVFYNIYKLYGANSFCYISIPFSFFDAIDGISSKEILKMKKEFLEIRSNNKNLSWYISLLKYWFKVITKYKCILT